MFLHVILLHYLRAEKIYTCLCREVDENVHILSRRQALIKFELRVCTSHRPPSRPTAGFSLSPFLPFPFSQDHCFQGDSQKPARGAKDCYERICGNPRSNLHADDNGCISSLIPRFCRRLLFLQVVFARQLARKKCRWLLMFYQVAPHLHLSLKGDSTAAKLNIDKNLIDLLQYIETDACGNYVINAKPGHVRDHAR